MNQQVCALRRVYRGRAGTRIAGERDDAARASGPHEAIGRQLSAVSKLDRFALCQLAPQRSFGNPGGLRLLDIKPPTSHVLFEDVAERGTAAVFSRKRVDVVAIPLLPHGVPRFDFRDLDGKGDPFDAELHGRAQDFLGAFGTVQQERLGPPLKPERSDQSDDAQKMIGMKVGEEDLGKREADPVAHHLALGPLTALEQQRLTLSVNGEATDVPFDCWPGGGGAEEGYG